MAAYAGARLLKTFREGMTFIDVSKEKIRWGYATKITGPLPSTLTFLDCEYSNITELPELPDSLVYLNISHSKITELPHLPSNLKSLNFSFNNVTHLPPLPPKLEKLNCSHTQLKRLPVLPATLREFNFSGTYTFEEPFQTLLYPYNGIIMTEHHINTIRLAIDKFYGIMETESKLGFLKNAESSYFKPLKANNDTITPKMQGLPNVVQNKIASYLTGEQGTVRNQITRFERNLQRLRNTTAPRRAGGRQSSSRRNKTRKMK